MQLRGHGGPFSLVAREGVWSERTVTVANRSDQPRRVTVGFESSEADQAQGLYTRVVTVPPRATMRVPLAYRAGKARRLDRKPGARPLGEMYIVLRDADTGAQLDRQYRLVTPVAGGVLCVGGVGMPPEDHDETSYLEHLGESELGTVKNVIASPPPDRWFGYSMVGIVRLDERGAADMAPSRRQALLDWVRRGGVLVILGGHEAVESLSGPWGQAAGVTPVGSHRVDRLAVTDPTGREQFEPVGLSWPLPMVELCCTGAQTIYEANGLPLLTRQALGDGWIFTLAVPTGALKDQRLHRIWWSISQARRRVRAVDADAFAEAGRPALQAIAGRQGPTRMTVTLVLAVPIVLVVAVYFFARRGRRERAWWALVPAALLIAAGMAWISLGRTDPPRLSHIGLITGLGDGQARRQGYFAFYSGPEEQTQTFTSDGERGLIHPAGLIREAARQFEIRTGKYVSLPDRRVEVQNTRAFLTDTVGRTDGIAGTMTFDADGLTGTLTNYLTEQGPIADAVLYANRRTYRLRTADGTGELRPGAETTVACGPDDLLGRVTFIDLDRQAEEEKQRTQPKAPRPRRPVRPTTRPARSATRPAAKPPAAPKRPNMMGLGEFTGSLQHTTTDRLRNELVGRLVSAPGIAHTVDTQPVLIGYMAASPADPLATAPAGVTEQGWTVVIWPVRLVRPERGKRVTVPAGLVDVTFGHVGAPVWDPMNERFNRTYRPGELLIYAQPPVQVGRLEEVELRLRVRMVAAGYRLDVRGQTPSQNAAPARAIELKSVRNPREVEVRIPEAGRFRDAEGRYVLSLRVRRLGESAGLGGGPPDVADMLEWTFQTVDVALKGTCR